MRNKKAFTLIEVLLFSAVLGAISYNIMNMMDLQIKNVEHIDFKYEYRHLESLVKKILSDSAMCTHNFKDKDATLEVPINALSYFKKDNLIKAGDIFGKNVVHIDSMKFGSPSPALDDFSDNKGDVYFSLIIKRKRTERLIEKQFRVHVETNPSDNLVLKCYLNETKDELLSEAGGDQYWKVISNPTSSEHDKDIFYEKGKIAVVDEGTPIPTFPVTHMLTTSGSLEGNFVQVRDDFEIRRPNKTAKIHLNSVMEPNKDGTFNVSLGVGQSVLDEVVTLNPVQVKRMNPWGEPYLNLFVGHDISRKSDQSETFKNNISMANIMLGHGAGENLHGGLNNIIIGIHKPFLGDLLKGYKKDRFNGNDNVFIGYNAGLRAEDVNFSTAIGKDSLRNLSKGKFNTAIGWRAGVNLLKGDNNIFIGNGAGYDIYEAKNSIFIFSTRLRQTSYQDPVRYDPEAKPPNDFESVPVKNRKYENWLNIENVLFGTLETVYDPDDLDGEENRLGLHTTDPEFKFDVNGDVLVDGGSIYEYSDRRLKRKITPIKSAKKTLKKLRPVTYVLKDDDSATHHAGFIAQEVQKVLPHLVSSRGKYLSLNYVGLSGYIVEAIKEDYTELLKLQERYKKLKKLFNEIKSGQQ